ncbi:hypothetical protein HK096_000851, partial [Nowakowskiella sp. JEL0078]
MASVNAEIRFAMNLNVLKRHDKTVVSILDSSSHVVVYIFEPVSQSWNKRGIEGTMFILQRNFAPFYSLFILNRLGVENLNVCLTMDMEFQMTGDYVIYRQADDQIIGLWIYEEPDRLRLANVLTNYSMVSLQTPMPLGAYPTPPPAKSKQNGLSTIASNGLTTANNSISHVLINRQDLSSVVDLTKTNILSNGKTGKRKEAKGKMPKDEVQEPEVEMKIQGLGNMWEIIEDVLGVGHTRAMHKGAFKESLKRLIE